jgi:hypothetical protein
MRSNRKRRRGSRRSAIASAPNSRRSRALKRFDPLPRRRLVNTSAIICALEVAVIVEGSRKLETVMADRNSLQKHVWRPRIILLTANGCGTAEIMRRSGTSKTAVWRWQSASWSRASRACCATRRVPLTSRRSAPAWTPLQRQLAGGIHRLRLAFVDKGAGLLCSSSSESVIRRHPACLCARL